MKAELGRGPVHRPGRAAARSRCASKRWASDPNSARSTRSCPSAGSSTGSSPASIFRTSTPARARSTPTLDFQRVLRKVARKLGPRALRNVHIHIAGIHFGDKGEIKHLNLDETDFRYDEWLQALRDLGVEGLVICESPNLEDDALMLKKLYLAQTTKS